jgi:hypothetical protein
MWMTKRPTRAELDAEGARIRERLRRMAEHRLFWPE